MQRITRFLNGLQNYTCLDYQTFYLDVFPAGRYAGPGSQSVTEKFRLGWSTYMSSSESVIYAVIDGRGSGARGQRHLHSVYRQLGTIEVDDQVTGARYASREMADDLPEA